MSLQVKAVILARVSSKGQEEEGYSLDSQVKLLHSYCENHDMTVAKVFKITESASKASQRRIFKDAMKFIEDHGVKNLIIEKVDRHVRNLHDAVETHDWLLADENKKVHFVKDSLILHKNSRSQEWLNWGIRVVMAKNYIDNLREEAMKGWAEKLAQGWLPAVPPPGYVTTVVEGKRIHLPDSTFKPLMQKVFRLYLEPHHSLNSIAETMKLMGFKTRKGRSYGKSQVQRILTNPFYIGINRFDGRDYPGAQEPIISKDIFNRVQAKMHGKRPVRNAKHDPVFKNLIICSQCDGVVTWQRQKNHYYGACQRTNEACKKRKFLREDQLEETIMEILQTLVCPSQEIISWVAETMRGRQKENVEAIEKQATALQAQISRLTRMEDSLYDDKLAGEISVEKYQEKRESINAQKAALQQQLDTLDTSGLKHLEQRLVLLELSQKASELYPKKTAQQKRLIITKLFTEMTYDADSVSVKLTNFAGAIAQKVEETHKIIGGKK